MLEKMYGKKKPENERRQRVRMRKQLPLLLLIAGAVCVSVSCGIFGKKQLPARDFYAMGTVCAINLYEDGTEEIFALISARLAEIEQLFSVSIAESDIAKINLNAGIAPARVHDEVIYLIKMACYFARKTGGAFDPAVGALSVLWAIGTDGARVPAQEEIARALTLTDYEKIQIDEEAKTVFLPQTGMIIDLGGIAKGYAADEVIKIAREHNVARALINLGGNVYVYGEKPRGKKSGESEKWRVGIKDPENSGGRPAAHLDTGENSVVTSGTYERYFDKDGIRYHHILDTKTGYPAESDALSVTIVSASSLAADALSTSVFILGKEKGLALLEAGFPEIGVTAEGLVITRDHQVAATPGLRGSLTVLPGNYLLIP
ncbi:MAG: FAD:protein FMN transferase [Treponemataceae bacterium]|nr:MAG: FAD:protein FMN transferase [Treponemataceae bacterium]